MKNEKILFRRPSSASKMAESARIFSTIFGARQRPIRPRQLRRVLGLGAGRFADDGWGKPALVQKREQRFIRGAKVAVGKGQVAFFAALGVGNAGKMRVEPHGPLVAEHLFHPVEQAA